MLAMRWRLRAVDLPPPVSQARGVGVTQEQGPVQTGHPARAALVGVGLDQVAGIQRVRRPVVQPGDPVEQLGVGRLAVEQIEVHPPHERPGVGVRAVADLLLEVGGVGGHARVDAREVASCAPHTPAGDARLYVRPALVHDQGPAAVALAGVTAGLPGAGHRGGLELRSVIGGALRVGLLGHRHLPKLFGVVAPALALVAPTGRHEVGPAGDRGPLGQERLAGLHGRVVEADQGQVVLLGVGGPARVHADLDGTDAGAAAVEGLRADQDVEPAREQPVVVVEDAVGGGEDP